MHFSPRTSVVPVPPTLLAGQATETDSEFVQAQVSLYSLLVEFQFLQQHPPPGVYVLPAFENLREWHGIVFVRQGWYKGGVFKFRIDLSEQYPEVAPRVFFVGNFVNHPLVDPTTGELDLNPEFHNWHSGDHNIIFVLNYIKRLFYNKDSLNASKAPVNKLNHELWVPTRQERVDGTGSERCQGRRKRFVS